MSHNQYIILDASPALRSLEVKIETVKPIPVRLTDASDYDFRTWYYCKKYTTVEVKDKSDDQYDTWESAMFLPYTTCTEVSIDGETTSYDLNTRTSDAVTGVNCPSESGNELCYCIQQCDANYKDTGDCQSVSYKEDNNECTYYNCVEASFKQKDGDEIFYMATGITNATKQCTGLAQVNSCDASRSARAAFLPPVSSPREVSSA